MTVSGRRSKIAVDCKCREDECHWEKSEIAVDCKCRGDEGQ